MSKKKLYLTCDVCDARNLKTEHYADYDEIFINADLIAVSEETKAALYRLPVTLNADSTVQLSRAAAIRTQNGSCTIKAGPASDEDILLVVNGSLEIEPGTEEVLKKYKSIVVNGSVSYPKSLSDCLGQLNVNGSTDSYPDDCIRLSDTLELDPYFAIRAREEGIYYAEDQVVLTDSKVDLAALRAKKVHFLTARLIVTEDLLAEAVSLFDPDIAFLVLPAGCRFVPGEVTLDTSLLRKYGNSLFIEEKLTLTEDSLSLLPRLTYLQVDGCVELNEAQEEVFTQYPFQYQELQVIRQNHKSIKNQLKLTVSEEMLSLMTEGLSLINCIDITLDETISPEEILKKLKFINCVRVTCTEAQKSAVIVVSTNVQSIQLPGEKEKAGDPNIMKITADFYTL